MNQKIKQGYKLLIDQASKEINTISVEETKLLVGNNAYVFVDLRDIRELEREGKIPGSYSCPRGMLEFWIDPDSPYHKEIFNQNKHYIFYCASAWRSALGAKTAKDMGLSPVSHIRGGFSAWKKESGPIEKVIQKG